MCIRDRFNREEFQALLKEIHKEKESVKEAYTAFCDEKNMDCQILKSNIKFEKFDLSSIVNQDVYKRQAKARAKNFAKQANKRCYKRYP